MAFEWTEDLAVGVRVIDSQHRELFSRINDLLVAAEKEKTSDEVVRLFVFLEDYIASHFVSEEKAMAIYGYPDIIEHKKQHSHFVKVVKELKESHSGAGEDPVLVDTLKEEVCDWIVNHVNRVDKELGLFLAPRIASNLFE